MKLAQTGGIGDSARGITSMWTPQFLNGVFHPGAVLVRPLRPRRSVALKSPSLASTAGDLTEVRGRPAAGRAGRPCGRVRSCPSGGASTRTACSRSSRARRWRPDRRGPTRGRSGGRTRPRCTPRRRAASRIAELQRGAQLGRHLPPVVHDRVELLPVAAPRPSRTQSTAAARTTLTGTGPPPMTWHELVALRVAPSRSREVADVHDVGPAVPLPTSGAQLHERVGGVRFSRLRTPDRAVRCVAPDRSRRRAGSRTARPPRAGAGTGPRSSRGRRPSAATDRARCCSACSSSRSTAPSTTRRASSRRPANPLVAATSNNASLRARDRRLSRDDLPRLGQRHLAGRERLTRGRTRLPRRRPSRARRAPQHGVAAGRARHPLHARRPRRRCASHRPRSLARTRAVTHAFSSRRELLGDRRAVVTRPESGIEVAQQLLQLSSKRTKTAPRPSSRTTWTWKEGHHARPSRRPLRLPEHTFAVNPKHRDPLHRFESYSNASTRSPCSQVSHW